MASSTSDLIVRLSLDTTNFEGAMSKFEGQMTKLQASCTNAGTGITNFKQVTAQLQTSAQTLTDKLAAQKQKVADLEAAYEKSKAETGENSEETKKLAAQLEQAKQKVSQTEQALKLVTRQLKLSQNGFYQLGTQLENIGTKLESVGKKVSQVGQQLTTKVTTPIVALGTVCVKTFTSFDDSLKTVQATMGLVAGSSEEADRQIALLNSTAQEMGRATRYSASEAASALNYLALAGCLGLALILTLCGTFAGALASEVENGIDAIEDAMMKGNTNTSSFFDGMDDLREGTSADTVPTPDDFPSKYNYGSGKIQDYSRDNMLRRLPEPEGNATVLNTTADPEHIQALFLWEEDNVPTKTRFTENMTGYFDSWNFRPYVTAIPVRTGVQPKGAVVLMAGGAYQFRGNYTDSLPTAAALRELGFQTFIVDYRLSPYTQEEGALDVARAVRFVRKNASVYGINPDAIAVMGFSAGGIQAGEFLMHYDEDVTGAALDSGYVPDELDAIPAHASAAGMIYSFYGRLSVGNMDASWLAEGNLPPTFYVYGTEDPFYRQFQQQYDVIRGMGIPTGRIVLNGWPHGFGSDGGWVTDYAAWLENVFANLSSKESFVIDRAGGFSYHTETMELGVFVHNVSSLRCARLDLEAVAPATPFGVSACAKGPRQAG